MNKLPSVYLKSELLNRNHHIFKCATNPNICYFIGIIDYFQLYDVYKKTERVFKRTIKCDSKLDTSAQPPKLYSKRFYSKMEEYFKSDEIDIPQQPQVRIQQQLGYGGDNYQQIPDKSYDSNVGHT